MRLQSYHKTRQDAEEFAETLRESGAEDVKVGKRLSIGYPVSSKAPEGFTREIAEDHLKSIKPEATEEYKYETSDIPAKWIEAGLEEREAVPVRTEAEIIEVVQDELAKAGVSGVTVRVSRDQGRDPSAEYADMTVWHRRGKWYINVHPLHLYTSEDCLREAAWHEVEHILG